MSRPTWVLKGFCTPKNDILPGSAEVSKIISDVIINLILDLGRMNYFQNLLMYLVYFNQNIVHYIDQIINSSLFIILICRCQDNDPPYWKSMVAPAEPAEQ